MISNEVWRPVEGYEEYYEVSDIGRVRSKDRYVPGRHGEKIRRGRIVAQSGKLDNPGYKRVHLSINGKAKWLQVHRLVALAFLPQPAGCNVVNHIDNNPANNCVDNLEWTTQKGNIQHAERQGRRNHKKIEISVYRINADGTKTFFPNIASATRSVGLKNSNSISNHLKHREKYKSAGGYKWEYAVEGSIND